MSLADKQTRARYNAAKERLLSGQPCPAAFGRLAEWILSKYGARVIDVQQFYNEKPITGCPPESVLVLVMDENDDIKKIGAGLLGRARWQKPIIAAFTAFFEEEPVAGVEMPIRRAFTECFGDGVREEVMRCVGPAECEQLLADLADPRLVEIGNFFGQPNFVFGTRAQRLEAEAEGLREVYQARFDELVAPHDFLGYAASKPKKIGFVDQEYLDEECNGSLLKYSWG